MYQDMWSICQCRARRCLKPQNAKLLSLRKQSKRQNISVNSELNKLCTLRANQGDLEARRRESP